MLARVRSLIGALLRRDRFENAMSEEMRFHLDARVDDLIASGLPRPEAKRRARLEFGGVERVKEHCRQARGLRLFDEFRQDIAYAWRTLARSPAFTTAAVLTLALGIGAVTIIYSVVHNVVLDPLPYRDAHRLVNVFVEDAQTGRVRGTLAAPEFLDFRDQSRAFEDVVGTLGQGMRYETPESVEYLRVVRVTPNFFDFMGLKPSLGRTITAEDGEPGAAPVAVLRHRAWMAYFGGDPGVIGRTMLVNGEPRTIIGVMPPRFTWHAADLWIPGPLDLAAPDAATIVRNFQARLRPGVTLEHAEAELNVIAARRARMYPTEYPEKFRVVVVNVIDYTVGPFSRVLYTALAAVGLLLLIACCNVANMLLARATTREREMMIRAALGAGRGRIVRQLMVESILLAAGGAAFGCLFAYAGIGALVARLPQNPLPGEVDIALNGPVLVFSLGAAVLSAVLFGMAPALYTVRRDLSDALKTTGKAIAAGPSWLRGLAVAEIAFSLVLILSAGLLMRTFILVVRVDLGFKPDNVLVVPVAFPPGRYTTAAERQRFYREALGRLISIPGVTSAAATTSLPPFDAGAPASLGLSGTPTAERLLSASVQLCTAAYFNTLGIQFTRGTAFTDVAADERPRLAVVNETLARQYFRGRDPLGSHITLVPAAGPEDPARHAVFEIAGVVRDVKNRGVREPAEPQVYLPWSGAGGYPLLLVRTATDATGLVGTIRREVSAIDRQVAVVQARTFAEALDRSFYAQPRFSLLVLGIFAAAGTLLVGVGVFSVMAYTVSRRKRELAVRMALDATRTHVCSVVLRSGIRLLALGTAAGVLASFATTRLLSTQLWNVSTHDPLTLAAALSLMSVIALLACYLPARRAMRVDPIGALREE